MPIVWVILFQILASLLIVAEVLIPSFGLLSVLSAGFFFYSYYLLNSYNPSYTPILFILNLFTVPSIIIFSVKILGNSPMALKKKLDKTRSFGAEVAVDIGEVGVTSTPMKPSGKVRFKNGFFDAITEGVYLDADTKVEVIQLRENRILVKSIVEKSSPQKSNSIKSEE